MEKPNFEHCLYTVQSGANIFPFGMFARLVMVVIAFIGCPTGDLG